MRLSKCLCFSEFSNAYRTALCGGSCVFQESGQILKRPGIDLSHCSAHQ